MLLESVVAVRFPNFGLPHAMVKGDQTMYIYIYYIKLYQTTPYFKVLIHTHATSCEDVDPHSR